MRSPRIPWVEVLAGLVTVVAAWHAVSQYRDRLPPALVEVPIGSRVPDLHLAKVAHPVRLADQMRGRPTVVVVFLGGCWPYCRNELTRLKTAVQHQHPRGVTVIATSPDQPEELSALKRSLELPFKLLSDPSRQAAGLCKNVMHCVLLLDSTATLRWAGDAESWHAPVDYERVIRAAQLLE